MHLDHNTEIHHWLAEYFGSFYHHALQNVLCWLLPSSLEDAIFCHWALLSLKDIIMLPICSTGHILLTVLTES